MTTNTKINCATLGLLFLMAAVAIIGWLTTPIVYVDADLNLCIAEIRVGGELKPCEFLPEGRYRPIKVSPGMTYEELKARFEPK
ncbi:MAG: hypothetical protein AAB388_04820 [Patescibacteria group bacterium]